DGIELRGHTSYTNWGVGSIGLYCSTHVLLTNLWVHDWALDSAITSDDTHGGIIGNYPYCSTEGAWVDHCEISNAEAQATRQQGTGTRSVSVRYSRLHDLGSAMLFGTVHDSEIYNIGYPSANADFDPLFHTNVTYVAGWEGSAVEQKNPAYVY